MAGIEGVSAAQVLELVPGGGPQRPRPAPLHVLPQHEGSRVVQPPRTKG